VRKEIEDWFVQAKADLKAAKDNIETRNFFVSAFLSQQSAEKALKYLPLEVLALLLSLPGLRRFKSFAKQIVTRRV
jgi:HEPN domain-containing protein